MTQTLPEAQVFTDWQVFAMLADAMAHHQLDATSISINNVSPNLVQVGTRSTEHVKAWAAAYGVDMSILDATNSTHYEATIRVADRKVTVFYIATSAAYHVAYDEAMEDLHAKMPVTELIKRTVPAPVGGTVKAIDLGQPEITCGRCALAVGAHTFGIGCGARLGAVPVPPADETERRPRLLHTGHVHVINPDDVAPGEPDDRGWDAPIKPEYVEAPEPGFAVPGPHTARILANGAA